MKEIIIQQAWNSMQEVCWAITTVHAVWSDGNKLHLRNVVTMGGSGLQIKVCFAVVTMLSIVWPSYKHLTKRKTELAKQHLCVVDVLFG